ncbi:uncharacterized protein CELE_F23D12.1 [Caenorhabditis elegans]|uniref:Uncharacterized protein n=1 Tax=Caenorhabditis elegans TaxID=6239 RepID=Q19757_CAEEL|nr:Uncharacterized protein CELE_F23D12.1 [Caenorhabditis elegans]CAA94913.2 Uncharacterized protein CELE_F23D12.1 [Caenorhabditis elegans]|eukprot:NP_510402.2 Uncharacterized protein CELE_F23D12.1 [Caenorhabditis elegans]
MVKQRGGGISMHFQHPDGFNPNDSIYKSCCCHAKTFTIFIGIFEIFTICFLLVAVLPDVTTRVCDKLSNDTESESLFDHFEFENIKNVAYVSSFLCHNNIFCFIWAIIQILSVVDMFYGIKTIRFWFFIPHFIFRIICLSLICLVDAWLIFRAASGTDDMVSYITPIVIIAVVAVGVIYATWIEIRCAHFVKRSRETGFSISVARPVGPATISLSENPQNPSDPPARRLPPLRHNQNQYVVNETHPPAPGNPNEANTAV